MFFYDFFYSEINPLYYFYWKMNIITFAQICGGFFIIVRKTHSPSVRASSPTTRTANSTLGVKRPTLRPRYTIYYFIYTEKNSL